MLQRYYVVTNNANLIKCQLANHCKKNLLKCKVIFLHEHSLNF